MINELGELNEQFYQLYWRLRENDESLTAKQADFMTDVLFEQYKQEYERLRLYSEINEKNDLYALRYRHATRIPKKKFLLFKNVAMKQANAALAAEAAQYFARLRENAMRDSSSAGQQEEPEEQADGDGGEWVEEEITEEQADEDGGHEEETEGEEAQEDDGAADTTL